MARGELYMRRGKKKLDRDLDIGNFIQLSKDYRIMRKVLFDHDQRFMMKFQKQDVLHSEEERSEGSSNPEIDLLFSEKV